jgi:hypothetical protein
MFSPINQQQSGDGDGQSASIALLAQVRNKIWNSVGATWDGLRAALSLDAGLTAGMLTTHVTRIQNNAGVFTSLQDIAVAFYRAISVANTPQVAVIELRGICQSLSIHMAASAATATLLVEVSVDNANWIQVDNIAAAAAIAKVYGAATAGGIAVGAAAGPLAPLSFKFIRVTAGAAGAGNTTTLTVGAK